MSRLVALLLIPVLSLAQEDAKARARSIRTLAERGSEAMPQLAQLLSGPDLNARLEAVKAVVSIGTQHSLNPLMKALQDSDQEIQIRAIDGLVNFYMPEYVAGSMSANIKRSGANVTGRLSDTNNQVIPPYIEVRAEVIQGISKLLASSPSMDVRANAARALGVLRGKAAIPVLVQALRSKDSRLMYESLIALQKIGDPATGPDVIFLLRDFDEKLQLTAIETAGLLRAKEALPALQDLLQNPRTDKTRRAALASIAMIPEPRNHPLFVTYLADKDEQMRRAAAEGLARLRSPTDKEVIASAFREERKTGAKLSLAFAAVALGEVGTDDSGPIYYLVNSLTSRAWRGVAQPFLIELARERPVRESLYAFLPGSRKEVKIALAQALAVSGDRQTVEKLEPLSSDADSDVAQEALRALRSLKARLPQ
jgi:HEAT repeat protein